MKIANFIKYLISIFIGIILYYILSKFVEKFNIGVPHGIAKIMTIPDGSRTQQLVPSPEFDNLAEATEYLAGDPDYTNNGDITYEVIYYPDDDPSTEPVVRISGITDVSKNDVPATFEVVNADDFLKYMHKTVYTNSMYNGSPREYAVPNGNTYRRVQFNKPMSLMRTGESCANYWTHSFFRGDMDNNGYTNDTSERVGGVISQIERGKKVWLKVEDLTGMIDSDEFEQYRKLSEEFKNFIGQWYESEGAPGRCVITPMNVDRLPDLPACLTGFLRLPNINFQYNKNRKILVYDPGSVNVQYLLSVFQNFLIAHYSDNPLEGFPLEQYVDYPIFIDGEALLDFRFLELTYKMSVSQMRCENVGVPLGNIMYLVGDRVLGMTETNLIEDLFGGNTPISTEANPTQVSPPKFYHTAIFGCIENYINYITNVLISSVYDSDILIEFIYKYTNNQLLTNEFYTNLIDILNRKQREVLKLFNDAQMPGGGVSDEIFEIYDFLSRGENVISLIKCLKTYNTFVQCLQAHNYRFVLLFRIFYWFDFDCEIAYRQIVDGDRMGQGQDLGIGQIYIGNFDWDFAPPMWAIALDGFTADITAEQLFNLNFVYMNRLLERLINNQPFEYGVPDTPDTNPDEYLFGFLSDAQISTINYTDLFNRLNVTFGDIIKLLCNIYEDYLKQIELGQNTIMIQRLYRGLIYNGLFLLVYVQNRTTHTFTIDPDTHILTITIDGAQVDINTLVQIVLNLDTIPNQFIRLIMELFVEFESVFPTGFVFPTDNGPQCDLVVANPIDTLEELTVVQAPVQPPVEPPGEPIDGTGGAGGTEGTTPIRVNRGSCGVEFRF
jgi:hypothetical protein